MSLFVRRSHRCATQPQKTAPQAAKTPRPRSHTAHDADTKRLGLFRRAQKAPKICATPKDASRLIRRLKTAGVLTRDQRRMINTLEPLNRVAPSDFGLSTRKVARLKQVLALVQSDTPAYNYLLARRAGLLNELAQVNKKKMPSLYRDLKAKLKNAESEIRHFASRPALTAS